jgi:hypothetical protein
MTSLGEVWQVPMKSLTQLASLQRAAKVGTLPPTAVAIDVELTRWFALGHHQHPAPHADSSGVVGRDETIAGAKIDPFSHNKQADIKLPGLRDKDIDASRISPLGEVREEIDA